MRRVLGRGGSWLVLAWAVVTAACDDGSATPVPSFATGGAFAAGASSGGAVTAGGSTTTGVPPFSCSASPLYFPVTRYSITDIDNSLDLVFGEGAPRLADGPFASDPVGYERYPVLPFVTALLEVARERVQGAASGVCGADEDAVCMEIWLRTYGDQLYRRPLTAEQVEAYRVPFLNAESDEARREVAVNVLAAMVLSPYFLLRLELADGGRITTHDVASRLAHLASRRVPDAELRARAQTEELYDPEVRLVELRRLWQTPAGRAARELQLLEWLGIDRLLAEDEETWGRQARDFISAVYDQQDGSFSAFFTSSRLPLNDVLAERYGLPLPGTQQLEPVELDQQLFAGLLSTGAFLSRYSRPSARGAAVLSTLLCAEVPAPPPSHVGGPLPIAETPRLSIQAALAGDSSCVPCHDTFDPTGFALEAFDDRARLTGFPTNGALRTPGTTTPVAGPVALGEAITGSEAARDCLRRHSLEYVAQRALPPQYVTRRLEPPAGEAQQPVVIRDDPETEWLRCLSNSMNAQDPSVTALIETVARSDLMVTRDDQPRRVVALDTSADPIEHAYQETLQLRGAYGEEGSAMIEHYFSTLTQLRDMQPPSGGAGAGGDSGDAGASGDGGAGGAGGAR